MRRYPHRPHHHGIRIRFRGPVFTIIGIVAAIWALIASGAVDPAPILDQLPREYVPNAIEKYLPEESAHAHNELFTLME